MEKNIEYRMVDFGLPSGLKWADRNVGAASPEAFGDYFMWGSTESDTDNVCDWAHAPFNGGSSEFNKEYFNAHKSEWLTGERTLNPEYDAAHVNMGDGWRMPTSADMQELLDGTTQTVEEVNGISGMRFISKTNGNSIFMPFAGFRRCSKVHSVGGYGNAWSSPLNAGDADYSHSLGFSRYGIAYTINDIRCYGFAVRGVHE